LKAFKHWKILLDKAFSLPIAILVFLRDEHAQQPPAPDPLVHHSRALAQGEYPE